MQRPPNVNIFTIRLISVAVTINFVADVLVDGQRYALLKHRKIIAAQFVGKDLELS